MPVSHHLSIYLSICRLDTLRVVFSVLHCYITCVFVFLFCDIGISYTRLELIYYYFMLTDYSWNLGDSHEID